MFTYRLSGLICQSALGLFFGYIPNTFKANSLFFLKIVKLMTNCYAFYTVKKVKEILSFHFQSLAAPRNQACSVVFYFTAVMLSYCSFSLFSLNDLFCLIYSFYRSLCFAVIFQYTKCT